MHTGSNSQEKFDSAAGIRNVIGAQESITSRFIATSSLAAPGMIDDIQPTSIRLAADNLHSLATETQQFAVTALCQAVFESA